MPIEIRKVPRAEYEGSAPCPCFACESLTTLQSSVPFSAQRLECSSHALGPFRHNLANEALSHVTTGQHRVTTSNVRGLLGHSSGCNKWEISRKQSGLCASTQTAASALTTNSKLSQLSPRCGQGHHHNIATKEEHTRHECSNKE